MKRRLAVLTLSVGIFTGLFAGLAASANAVTVPPLCLHDGLLQVGYCPG